MLDSDVRSILTDLTGLKNSSSSQHDIDLSFLFTAVFHTNLHHFSNLLDLEPLLHYIS